MWGSAPTLFRKMRLKILFNTYTILLSLVLFILILLLVYLIYYEFYWWSLANLCIILYVLKPISFMFSQTKNKIRTYEILMKRNVEDFNESSFKTHLDTPCSRIVVKTVLKDLSIQDRYPTLKKKYKTSFFSKKNQNKTVIFKR